ncbi:MAG: hypothetical protein RLZZ458_1754 [Planctomycetota bacterium]
MANGEWGMANGVWGSVHEEGVEENCMRSCGEFFVIYVGVLTSIRGIATLQEHRPADFVACKVGYGLGKWGAGVALWSIAGRTRLLDLFQRFR